MLRNRINAKHMMLTALGTLAFMVTVSAQAGGAGAFLGGIAVAKIGQNVRDRNDYEEDQAYYAQQQAQAAQSQAASAPRTTQQRLDDLDKLAANGYITKEEYKSRRAAILDSH